MEVPYVTMVGLSDGETNRNNTAFLIKNPLKLDLMISSSRSDHDPQADIKLFSKKIVKTLTGQELSSLSRMVSVRTTDPAFRALASAMRCEGGANRIISSNFNGFFIKNAVLFRLVSPSESPTIVT